MRGGPPSDSDTPEPDRFAELFGGIEWRTGTHLDRYTPLYAALVRRGITQHDADLMDITMVALTLGISADSVRDAADDVVLMPDGTRHPATTPAGIKVPSWWRGNRAAYRTSTRAGRQLSVADGSIPVNGDDDV